jgi:aryl sulfotransferase
MISCITRQKSLPKTEHEFFLHWIGDASKDTPSRMADFFFDLERSFWTERRRPNLLLVHYNDLKADLSGEMKRIASFLGITTPDALWPQLVEAASFEAMKRDGGTLMTGAERHFIGGHQSFLYRGTNSRWRGVLTDADLELYERKINAQLSPSLIRWLIEGRLRAGDPTSAPD